jgi:alpha-galactosidase
MKRLIVLVALAAQFCSAETHRVLFLGNSITKHGPKPDIGWTANWGMAASAEEKDFVHIVAAGLAKKWGAAPEIMVRSLVDLERGYASFDVTEKLKEPVAFGADMIIVAIGENVPRFKNDDEKKLFTEKLRDVLARLNSAKHPMIVVRSCFWADATKDQILKEACGEIGGAYVDISALGKDEANYARSERKFSNDGVARHPGDKGMQAIASAILEAIAKKEGAK